EKSKEEKSNSEIKKKIRTYKLSEKEIEFCVRLRQLILENPNLTIHEVRQIILENKKFSCIFMSRHLNYNSVLTEYFKNKPNPKPPPYYEPFYLL
ncbi:hypothetical protein H8356DRAFT_965248, partial [Neocallimastix lanati (nom. inval.)]